MNHIIIFKKNETYYLDTKMDVIFTRKILTLFTLLISFFIFVQSANAIVYVDPNGDGTGGPSWAQAYNTLETAISNEGSGETFWVAAADEAYTPSSKLEPKEGSKFYGGFSGNEIDLSQRDVQGNQTIIDGQSSLKHVIYVSNQNIQIDGFTIQNGSATSGGGLDTYGGGILVVSQSVIIKNCTFTGNVSNSIGGAIFIDYGSATIEDSIFQNNSSHRGGALGTSHDSDLTITGCSFSSNFANRGTQNEQWGGAIYTEQGGTPELSDCSFSNNTAAWIGGAICFNQPQNGSISDSNFQENSVTTVGGNTGGGGVAVWWDGSSEKPAFTINDCLFTQNTSTKEGGGVYSNYSTLSINNSEFQGNTALNGGAVMLDYKIPEPSTIDNCLFMGNIATNNNDGVTYSVGGAIRSYEQSLIVTNSVFAFNSAPGAGAVGLHAGGNSNYTATFNNCTFYGNDANESEPNEGYGGAIIASSVSMYYLNNCIFWANQADGTVYYGGEDIETRDIYNAWSSNMTTRHTDMETRFWFHATDLGTSEIHDGSFASDPLFVDPDGEDNEPGTLDDNFRLSGNSPCLDRADYNYAPELDIVLSARVDLKNIPNLGFGEFNYADIGAYEALMPFIPMAPVYMLLLKD